MMETAVGQRKFLVVVLATVLAGLVAFVGVCAVVYESEWLIDHEGGEEMIGEAPFLFPPQWSMDGSKMIISQLRGGYLVDLSDGNVTLEPIDINGEWDVGHPIISPDGSLLAITSQREVGDTVISEIGVSNPDGSDYRNLKKARGYLSVWDWSPDSDSLVFTSMTRVGSHPSSMYTMTPDGSSLIELVESGLVGQAVWSPDGQRIAFLKGDDIHVVDRNGSNLTKLGKASSLPAWSPDGSAIAFLGGGDQYSLFVVKPDGSELQKIADIDPEHRQVDSWGALQELSWSPDGSEILLQDYPFIRIKADGAIIDEGEAPYAVFWGREDWYTANASWSPDGSRIAVSVSDILADYADEGDVILFTMARDGSDKRVLAKANSAFGRHAIPNEQWEGEGEWEWYSP